MLIRTLLGTGLTVAAACALAQSSPATPALSFEVASLKPAPPPVGKGMFAQMGGDPGRLNYSNVSLRDLIRQAYQLKDYQITGPDWLNNERFDLVAKLPDGAPNEQAHLMLQTLLAERFRLTVHHEKKDLPAYALTVAKSGLKMKEHTEEDSGTGPNAADGRGGFEDAHPIKAGLGGNVRMLAGRTGMMMGPGRLRGLRVPMAILTDMLSRQLGRPVVDETGLTATYDLALNWTPEPGEGGGMGMKMMKRDAGDGGPGEPVPGGGLNDADAASAPSLAVALQQQLGLKLEQKKLPLEMLVVDHAEKVPTEN